MTDGAAAVLLMTRREALNRGLPVLGIFRSFAAVGVDPAIMGVGPAVAIPAAVAQVSLCAGVLLWAVVYALGVLHMRDMLLRVLTQPCGWALLWLSQRLLHRCACFTRKLHVSGCY